MRYLEASTGIEPVYTDLQSAASPLRQLAEVAFLLWRGVGGVKQVSADFLKFEPEPWAGLLRWAGNT